MIINFGTYIRVIYNDEWTRYEVGIKLLCKQPSCDEQWLNDFTTQLHRENREFILNFSADNRK